MLGATTLAGRTVLISGGEPDVVSALLAAGESAEGDHDAVVINLGADWTGAGWDACVHTLYDEAPLPDGGVVVACGPPLIAGPGPGYAEYVKARLVLGRFVRETPGAMALGPPRPLPAAGETRERRIATLCDATLALLAAPLARRHVVDADVAAVRSAGGPGRL